MKNETLTEITATATPEQLNEVVMNLSPRSEIDDQGLNRTIFEYNGITFAFLGREETPTYHTLEESRPIYLGRESVVQTYKQDKPLLKESQRRYFKEGGMTENQIQSIEDENVSEWQAEHDRFLGFTEKLGLLRQKNSDKPEHLLVEQSAYGLFALLERIEPDNAHWKAQREAVSHNQYDDEAILLIDMVTALSAVSLESDNTEQAQEHPPLGEATTILAVLGNEQAQRLAKAAVKAQEKAEAEELARRKQVRTESAENSEALKDVEPFAPADIVVVHATSHEPELSTAGYLVQTTHDATGYPRPSIHTALNHKVDSHMMGSWDDSDYVLIAGFDKMLETNGSPRSINGADTWWTRNPGEKLEFPDATLIAPGSEQTELLVRNGSRVTYKSNGYTAEDLESVDEILGYGLKDEIMNMLKDENGQSIEINSEAGQHIIANIVRDALARLEITKVRGKELFHQLDDKFLSEETQRRLHKMSVIMGLDITSSLHFGGSDEDIVEREAGNGTRLFGALFNDPRIRRIAYASGMMNASGTARQEYLRRKKYADLV